MRHHYSVSAQGLPEASTDLFHTFAEAQARFDSLVDQARQGGREVKRESYWRKELAGSGAPGVRVALDDAGLLSCGDACGQG